ncbi:MAG TPA: alanine racemase, partial [Ruminococcaceae bacterium]|nr:alanine racemase [Oscillospiraceae bacterium]
MDYLRRSWAEVDLDAIAANYWMIKSKTGRAKIMSVIKADAYGHGAAFVAKRLEREGTDWFAV